MDFETLRKNTAKVIKFVRKSQGLSQYELAQLMEVSQANVSKYESGQLIPSASEWAILCLKTNTPLDSNVHGFVDRLQKVSVLSKEPVQYKIDKKFVYQPTSCNRFINPLYYAGKEIIGEQLDKKLKAKKVDPNYFLGIGMPANDRFISFLVDLIETEANRSVGQLPLKNYMLSSLTHGMLEPKIANKNRVNGLKNFCTNSLYYSNAFSYDFKSVIEKNQFLFQSQTKDKETSATTFDYNIHYSKALVEAVLDGSEKSVHLSEKNRDNFSLVIS